MLVTGQWVVDWVARQTSDYGTFGKAQAIGWMKGRELAAGVVYCDWNRVNVQCHIASDGSKKWASRQFLWTIFDYPFVQLGVNRITVCVGEGNSASRRFVEHLGFRREATLHGAHPTGDLLVYWMKKEWCRWISAAFYKPLAKAA